MKLIIIAISLIAGVAHANPFTKSAGITPLKANMNCTDFSGTWKGLCTSIEDGSTTTAANNMAMEMWSCDAIELEKNTYPIDGIKTESTSRAANVSTIVMNMTWNDNQKKEFINVTIDEQILTFKNKDKILWNGSGTLKIENNKLVLNLTATLNGKSLTRSCEYTR